MAFGEIRAELVGERFARVGVDVEERDLRALIEEMFDEDRADAGRAARDQHRLADEARIARERAVESIALAGDDIVRFLLSE